MADLNHVLTQVATNNATNQNGSQSTNQSQTPYFTPTQIGMQGQAQNLMQQILTGQVQNMGPTQQMLDAGNALFNQRQLPKLAAIHGSGSPALNAAQQDFNLQLLSQVLPQQQQFAQNAYNSLAGYAFNPTGFQNQGNQNQQMQTDQKQMQKNTDTGGILGTILNGLGGILGG